MGIQPRNVSSEIKAFIFFPAVGGFLFGVLAYYGWHSTSILILCIGCALLVLFYKTGRKIVFVSILVFLLGIGVGIFHGFLFEKRNGNVIYGDGDEITTVFRLVDGSSRGPGKEFSYRIRTLDAKEKGDFLFSSYDRYTVSTCVEMNGTVKLPKPFETDTGRMFAYDEYLASKKVVGIVEENEVTEFPCRQTFFGFFRNTLFTLSLHIEKTIREIFPPVLSGLGEGLVIGNKQALPEQVSDDMRSAGLSHVVVLSGYNIMLVMSIARIIFSFFLGFYGRRIGALSFGWILIFISGAEVPALRAGVMASIGIVSDVTSRPQGSLRAVLLAVFLLVLLNPRILLSDISFQLSFLAMVGIVWVAPRIEEWTEQFRRIPEWVRKAFSETSGASVLVFPLIAFSMGSLPLYGILANIVVAPLVQVGTMGIMASVFAGMIWNYFGALFGSLLSPILSLIIGIAQFVARLPLSLIYIPEFRVEILVAIYVILGGLIWFVLFRGKRGR